MSTPIVKQIGHAVYQIRYGLSTKEHFPPGTPHTIGIIARAQFLKGYWEILFRSDFRKTDFFKENENISALHYKRADTVEALIDDINRAFA